MEFNWTDEAIKEPIKFLEKLVEEGLVPVDNFTMDYETYISKVNLATEEKNMGCYHAFANHDTTEEIYVAMSSIDTGNGKAPLTRVQTNTVVKNMFAIFSNCEYPEVAMRLAELIADPLMGIQAQYGMVDGTYMTETEDGKYMVLNYPAGSYRETSAPGNIVPYLLTEEDFENFVYEEGSFTYTRNKAIEEKYSKTQMSRDNLFPNITISAENLDRISELYTDISGYVNSSIADWIVNGGVDEGWDEYLAQLEDYGLDEYLSLLQEELDAFNSK